MIEDCKRKKTTLTMNNEALRVLYIVGNIKTCKRDE